MGLDDKSNITVNNGSTDQQDGPEVAVDDKKEGTAADRADMYRLVKTKELRVRPFFLLITWSGGIV